VAGDLIKPNGIIGTADGKMMYVSDMGSEKIYAYTINGDASLSSKTLFVNDKSDGMTIDNKGNVYITNSKGVTVFNKEGEQVLNIPTGQGWTANVTFGGPERNILFITASTSVYTLKMNVKGVR
jgi:gluconolactonase